MANPAGYLFRVGQSRTRPRATPPPLPAPAELGVHWAEPGLFHALQQLTERQRVCVALVVGQGCSLQMAADLLGLSKSSVQNHVERAMAHLRKHLGVTD